MGTFKNKNNEIFFNELISFLYKARGLTGDLSPYKGKSISCAFQQIARNIEQEKAEHNAEVGFLTQIQETANDISERMNDHPAVACCSFDKCIDLIKQRIEPDRHSILTSWNGCIGKAGFFAGLALAAYTVTALKPKIIASCKS